MKYRKSICVILFFVGLTLFAFSLMPFFRNFTDNFWIMTVVSLAIIILAGWGIFYRPKEKIRLTSRYERKGNLITRPEYNLLKMLREIAPEKYEVVPQVALASVIEKRTNTTYRNELFRIIDYCFVDRDTFEPLLLVELNDNSHNRADRRARDEKVAAICEAAKIPLVTFWVNGDLSFAHVKKTVLKAILK